MPKSIRSARIISTGTAILLLAFLSSCAPHRANPSQRLWEKERAWVHTDEAFSHTGGAWIQGVPLKGDREIGLDLPRASIFKTVVFPLAGPCMLDIHIGNSHSQIPLDRSMCVDFPLPAGKQKVVLSCTREACMLNPRIADPDHRGRRIIFILGDALRYDLVSREGMPEIVDYFKTGCTFRWAFSPETWTLPVLASIFTGKLPSQIRAPDGSLISLPARDTTLADALSDKGYFCAAVTANYTVNHENGYSQGFDFFGVPDARHPKDPPDADWVGSQALFLLQTFSDEDLFLYLHYMDVHEPYTDHERHLKVRTHETGETVPASDVKALKAAYASSARHLSSRVRPLLDFAGDNPTVVFTADHGEEFDEHGGFSHGPSLFNEVNHVPLLIRGEGIEAGVSPRPTSTRWLMDFLAGGGRKLWTSREPVTTETFSHGPPRFTAILDKVKVHAFARPAEPMNPSDPVDSWVLKNYLDLRFTDIEERTEIIPDEALITQTINALCRQFDGFRRGVYILIRGSESFQIEVKGIQPGGWVWGKKTSWTAWGGSPTRLDVSAADPFVLAFFPSKDGMIPQVKFIKGTLIASSSKGRPMDISRPGGYLWLDPGRPPDVLTGMEETLQRLRALGYIR